MYYFEWLRVRRVFIVVGIVLAVLLALNVWARIRVNETGMNTNWSTNIPLSERATQTEHKLANGINETIIDDPSNGLHAVIDTNPSDWSRSIDVTGPKNVIAQSEVLHPQESIIAIHVVSQSTNGATQHVVVTQRIETPIEYLFVATMLFALITATIFGTAFGIQNSGHLEIAFTVPARREETALRLIGMDLLGILGTDALVIIAAVLAVATWTFPHLAWTSQSLLMIGVALLGPIAWYAMLLVATASLRRGFGVAVGLAWPVAIFVLVMAHVNLGTSNLAQSIQTIFGAINVLNPLEHMNLGRTDNGIVDTTGYGASIVWLCGLAIAYLALAIAQWRRVEA